MQWTEFSFILKPSSLGGIGIFTTHAIPKGVRVFSGDFSPRKMKITEVPTEFLKYCIFLDNEMCLCPQRFDRMEIGWYLNHSDQPNIFKNLDNRVKTLREIQAGDEILIDYNQFDEPEHFKEAYYTHPGK